MQPPLFSVARLAALCGDAHPHDPSHPITGKPEDSTTQSIALTQADVAGLQARMVNVGVRTRISAAHCQHRSRSPTAQRSDQT